MKNASFLKLLFLAVFAFHGLLSDAQSAQEIKRSISKHKSNASLYLALGRYYQNNNQEAKAKEQYHQAIKHLVAEVDSVLSLGGQFVNFGLYTEALAAYSQGNELLPGGYPFSIEKAEVYGKMGDDEGMINAYLDVLELGASYLNAVQNALQLGFDTPKELERNKVIKSQLVKRIQNKPDQIIFEQLLVYILMQQHDYEAALKYEKALDNRLAKGGAELFAFATICSQNKAFNTAAKALQYIVDNGAEGNYFVPARIALLENQYKAIAEQSKPTSDELLLLEKHFEQELPNLGPTSLTLPLYTNYAHLEAFFLHRPDKGDSILTTVLMGVNLKKEQVAAAKLELGDIQLLSGKIWDASLTYSQIEKAFKYDVIGQEAKLRNARLAYYTNDFKWALAQLNVLKASTSKLISNDAMYLSVLITDNIGWDSVTVPLEIYARAELLAFQNSDSLAQLALDSVIALYPNHPLTEYVAFLKADVAIRSGHCLLAESNLYRLTTGASIKVLFPDKALFKLGLLHETCLQDKLKAMQDYHDLLLQFPNSIYVNEARKHFRNLRGDNTSP